MKKIVIIMISAMMTFSIAGCGEFELGSRIIENWNDEAEDNDVEAEDNHVEADEDVEAEDNHVEADEDVEAEDDNNQDYIEKEQAKQYYAYLNEVVLKEKNNTDISQELLPLEPLQLSVDVMKSDMYGWDIFTKGYTGLVSAFLEDFDHDGDLEMLGVFLRYKYTYDTIYRDVTFDPGTEFDDKSSQNYCMVLDCTVYDMDDDGEIAKSGYEYAIMPTDSWGKLLVGIEKVNEEYYVFGYSTSENMSTYGPSHFVVGNLTAGTEGKSIQWRYSSPLDAGRANFGNYNEILNINSPMEIKDTTLSTLNVNQDFELGSRLITKIDFDYVDYGGDEMIMTPTDNTELRKHLESGGETWERIELPQGGNIELPETENSTQRLGEIMEEMNLTIGVVFKENDITEENGKINYTYISERGNVLQLTWDVSEDILSGVSINGYGDAEWNAVKDVLLYLPELGFTPEETALFAGEVSNWGTYTNGVEINGWKVHLFQTVDCVFRAYRN